MPRSGCRQEIFIPRWKPVAFGKVLNEGLASDILANGTDNSQHGSSDNECRAVCEAANETNQTAMALYDKVAQHSGFVVYRKEL